MGKKKGDSFMTQPPFEAMIAIVFFFLLIMFLITQSGGISSILKSVCDKVPALCAGSVSSLDYEIAKQSKGELKCGINTAMSGGPQCMEASQTKAGPGPGNAAQVAAGSANTALPGGGASLKCDIRTGYPEIEYEESCEWYSLTCTHSENVWYVLDSDGKWKWKSNDLAVSQNDNKFYAYRSLSEMGAVLNKIDNVHVEIKNNLENINSQNINPDERFRKGMADAFAKVINYTDKRYGNDDKIIVYHKNGKSEIFDKDKINEIKNLGLEQSAKCNVTNFNLPETFMGITGEAKEFINALGDPTFLVYYQKFPAGEDTDWSSMSAWFTDVGKLMMVGMCVFDTIGMVKIGATTAASKVMSVVNKAKASVKAKLVKVGEKITKAGQKIGIMADEELARVDSLYGLSKIDKDAAKRIANTVEERAAEVAGAKAAEEAAALQRGTRDIWNRAIVDDMIEQNPGMSRSALFDEISKTAQIPEGGALTTRQAFYDVFDGGTTSVDLKVLYPGRELTILGKLMKNVFKFWNGNQERLSQMLKSAKGRFGKLVTYDVGFSYFAARVDSELGKFVKPYPNSLVTGMPLSKEEPDALLDNVIPKPTNIIYPDKQNLVDLGRPVILIKDGIGNPPTPFYLASPCNANLTIESKTMSCGSYFYDMGSHEATCNSPSQEENPGFWDSLTTGATAWQNCGSLVAKGYASTKAFQRVKTTAASIVENMNNAGVYGGEVQTTDGKKRIKITDPINHIEFYYDKDNQIIDYIGGNIEPDTPYITGETGSFAYSQRNISGFMGSVKESSRNWAINSNSDGRSLHFDQSYLTERSSAAYATSVTIKPPIITTKNGVMGLTCYKDTMGTDMLVKGSENAMMGEAVIGSEESSSNPGKEYIICNSPEIYESNNIPLGVTRIYFDAETGKFYGMYVGNGLFIFAFIDSGNDDGKIDIFGQYYYTVLKPASKESNYEQTDFEYRVFSDKDNNGRVDALMASDCNIPEAITISVKQNGKDANGNNYCYKSTSAAWGVGSTILSFGMSAVAKASPIGTVAALAVDCTIAYLEVYQGAGHSNWPRGWP